MKRAIAWWNKISLYGAEDKTPGVCRRIILTNQVGMTLGMVALLFAFLWLFKDNPFMIWGNFIVAGIHLITPWINRKGFYNLSRYSILFWLPTAIFVFTGMVGKDSEVHTWFYTITAFSCLLFDPKERIKLIIAVVYPITLFAILFYHNFKLFPNLTGGSHGEFAVVNFFVNFLLVSLSMFYLYRTSEKSEGQYKELYEKHVESQRLLDEERARAIHGMRMAALGEMAGGIAHEINSPLNVITILSEQLQKRIPAKAVTDEMLLDSVTKINLTANRIGEIVQSLRTISRTGEGLPLKEADMKVILHETLVLCKERFRTRNIHVDIDIPDGLPSFRCRKIEISQVLLNLLNNSCDALEGIANPVIEIKAWMNGPLLSLGLADNGPGIPAAIREKIFLPFFTTKEVGKGTGLGLSLSKGLIEANGGQLYLNTEVDKTQFVIEFKISEPV